MNKPELFIAKTKIFGPDNKEIPLEDMPSVKDEERKRNPHQSTREMSRRIRQMRRDSK